MSNPFFSVIIPCYNSWQFMERGLKSLTEQTYHDFEVLLIDDCSVDDTYERLLAYQKTSELKIRVFRNERNCGPGVTRNYGIQQAFGAYIAFLDSDDWYEKDCLEQMFREVSEKEADIVFCDFYRCLAEGERKWIRCTAPYVSIKDKKQYVALSYDSLCVSVVRRELFDKIALPNLYNAEDSVTIPLLLAQSSKVSFLSKPLYNYFCRKNSLSTTKELRVIKEICEAYRYLYASLPQEYSKEIEFRGIRLIIYGVVFKALQAGMLVRQINAIVDEFQQNNKYWYKNEYLKYLPYRKRMFVVCVRWKMYSLLRLYVLIQELLLKI